MNEYSSYLKNFVSGCIAPGNGGIKYSRSFWTKLILIAIATTFIVVNTIFGLVLPDTDVPTIRDKTFELTESINKYLRDHKTVLHMILIFSSLCIDTVVMSIFIYWVCYGRSWRIFFSCIFFYIFRGFIQVSLYPNTLEYIPSRIPRRICLGISRLPITDCMLPQNE
jgi:Na+/melibiose symporter-like transporter